MAGKTGQRWGQPKPRGKYIPSGPRPSPSTIGDAADSEPVIRCRSCGLPSSKGNEVLPGFWRYAARPGIVLALCERCVIAFTPDPDTGTVELQDVA